MGVGILLPSIPSIQKICELVVDTFPGADYLDEVISSTSCSFVKKLNNELEPNNKGVK